VLSESDGLAGGVIAALAARGLAGTTAVSGQDGDGAGLNAVALGTQTVDVWKDARKLGTAAAAAAAQLCAGTTLDQVTGAAPFRSPAGTR
jgi:D-xylose transport system substrate-binding protein